MMYLRVIAVCSAAGLLLRNEQARLLLGSKNANKSRSSWGVNCRYKFSGTLSAMLGLFYHLRTKIKQLRASLTG
jgi:23S rRNA maturation mini-RNase III